MKKTIFIICICVAILSIASPNYANATPATKEGAEELKAILSEYIDLVSKAYSGIPTINLEYKGELSVTPKGDYYTAVIPGVSFGISNPDNPADSFLLEMDPTVINASKENDDAWSMSFAIPMPIKGKDGNGESIFNINIGKQKAHMLYMPSLKTSPKYYFSYKDISITDIKDTNIKINIGEALTSLKLDKKENMSWSGPGKLLASDIAVSGDDIDFKIKSLDMNATYTDFNFEAMALMYDEIMKMDLNHETMSEKQANDFMSKIFSTMFSSMGGMTTDLSVNGVDVSYSDPVSGKNDSFYLGQASFGFGGDNLKTDKAGFELKYGMKDLKMSEAPAEMHGFIPSRGDFHMKILNTPIQTLLAIGKKLAEQGDSNPVSMQAEFINAFVNAGTKIIIEKQDLETPEIGVTTSGTVDIDASAVFKAIADITLKIRNLDGVIAKFSNGTIAIPPGMQQIIGALTMAQAMGVREAENNGQSMHVYKMQLTPQGQMLLNGNDMGGMLGMGARQGGQQLKQ